MSKEEFESVVEQTQRVLRENTGWRTRWAGYASNIRDSKPNIEEVRKLFRERPPLMVYLNITSAKKAKNSVTFDLRYWGQIVAKLTGYKDESPKLTTKGYDGANREHFDYNIRLSNVDWDGKEAGKFRKYFKDHDRKGIRSASVKRKNVEHRLESQFLTEFSALKHKVIRNIKPVRFCGVRFPMPTPINASNHKIPRYPEYGRNGRGGGIDILARIGTGGPATRLCVMELKDENQPSETPIHALKQAVAYTTFIHELLRSQAGQDWWELFEFGGKIPDSLELHAACVMPSNDNNDYCSFRDMELNINENDTIKLHYLYFTEKEEDGRITIEPGDTTLPIKLRES
ncbi:hypothetical protein ACFLWI_03275 [Chloroflexota bacterium]